MPSGEVLVQVLEGHRSTYTVIGLTPGCHSTMIPVGPLIDLLVGAYYTVLVGTFYYR